MDVSVDERFSHIGKDPRFRMMPKQDRKVKIDKRFQAMFKSNQFKLKYSVDKRGRPVNQSSSENLKQFYELSDSEEETDNQSNKAFSAVKERQEKRRLSTQSLPEMKGKQSHKKKLIELLKKRKEFLRNKSLMHSQSKNATKMGKFKQNKEANEKEINMEEEEEDSSDDSGEEIDPLGIDVARGMGNVESSSESESESEDELEHEWGELDADAPRNEDTSARLAVCNVDWDRIKATDLMAVFNSFKPTGGLVKSVKIFPSEFGRQKMKEEDQHGPAGLLHKDEQEIDFDSLEGQKIQMERLRTYQLQRLRYYYAVVECDSPQTASAIYDQCDNMEIESSSSKLDLRFIPDDVTFDVAPTSQVTDTGNMTNYKPQDFKTTALHQSKVVLTWDETDKERSRIMQQAFESKEFNDDDVKMLIASSDDDNDDDEGDAVNSSDEGGTRDDIAKYRSLLKEVNESEQKESENNDMEMEITWETGLKEETEELVKKKLSSKEEEMTPWEKYLKKRREKKMEKIEIRKNSKQTKPESVATFSDDELPEGVDLTDSFFTQSLSGDKSGKKGVKKKKKKDLLLTPEEIQENERKKAELELLMMAEEDDGKKHFSMDAILENEQNLKKKNKRKNKKKKTELFEDDFKIDVDDKRFNAMYTSHHFALDPSDPNFKRTKATEALIDEKQKRREEKETNLNRELMENNEVEDKLKSSKDELNILVKSIKNKTNQFHKRKNKKE
ncbi:ESF1 homolog [Antedon mediterranea]|uniref:ESF1 homolog n=1 Tax=Antedon mediterranea TaxID=105859 RepID=UPI003AF5E22A